MDNEKFKLWRLALSTIHFDGNVSAEEKKWFAEKINTLKNNRILNFTEDQIAELQNILETPVENILKEFKDLKNPADCSMLLHLVRVISHIDNEVCQNEKALYEKLEKACLEGVNQQELDQELINAKIEDNKDQTQDKQSFFMSVTHSLIDTFDKYNIS